MRPSRMSQVVLLDTHVWVRYAFQELPPRRHALVKEIERARAESRLRLSIVSIWEVGMLESRGRIWLGMDCLDWVRHALGRSGAALVPLSPEIAVASTRLPGGFRSDPMDCMIVATARELRARLVTADENMKAYADQGFVDVLPL
jgi:PIN domain nuclease of toxin-antitoxin system